MTPTKGFVRMAKGSGIPKPTSMKAGSPKAGATATQGSSKTGGKPLATTMKEEFDYLFLIVMMTDPQDLMLLALE